MSYFEDEYEYEPSYYAQFENRELTPHVDDLIWIDGKGKNHYIPEMDIEYVEAVIRFLDKKGFREDIPKALFKRYNERHKLVTEEFDEI